MYVRKHTTHAPHGCVCHFMLLSCSCTRRCRVHFCCAAKRFRASLQQQKQQIVRLGSRTKRSGGTFSTVRSRRCASTLCNIVCNTIHTRTVYGREIGCADDRPTPAVREATERHGHAPSCCQRCEQKMLLRYNQIKINHPSQLTKSSFD